MFHFVRDHACDKQTDGRTDRQTDRILIARPRLHFMQRGKNQSRNATVRVPTDGHTDTLTDRRKPIL